MKRFREKLLSGESLENFMDMCKEQGATIVAVSAIGHETFVVFYEAEKEIKVILLLKTGKKVIIIYPH